jgi:3-methyladenine DNA glycosylase AlkD
MSPLRILAHKEMLDACHDRVKLELLTAMHPQFVENVIIPLFSQYENWLALLNKKTMLWVRRILFQARLKGYEVTPYARDCDAERCTTCLGKHSMHFPYFKVNRPMRKYIKKEEMRDWLREIGLTEEEIEEAFSTFRARAVLLQLRHGTAKGLGWLGVAEFKFEEAMVVDGGEEGE